MKPMAIALLCGLVLTAGCGKQASGGWGERVVHVVAAEARQQAIEETIKAVGTLTANEHVDVKSETEGVIEAIHFEEGQRVEEGQVLVELDRVKLSAALAEAQANLRMADSTRQRYAALLATQAVAQQEADQANATWAATQALVDRLTAEVEDATITAPFAGMAGARLLSVGQFIPRGTSITTLIDPDPMKLEFRVPERFLGRLAPQQAVKLTTAAFPETTFAGDVYFIDPQVDPSTRTVLLKATVPNRDGRLRQGMFASVTLVVQVKERAVVIPDTALLYQGDTTFVYAIDSERQAQRRPVTIGVHLVDAVEVLEGLRAGEQVVAEGHQKLHPGAKVEPRFSAQSPDP